ncbi:hypothetical protein TWF730_004578 [Orbilia blumenaviensis]|uniref:Uncharacterized protein n=1 Tax=Orbilia blumenaviensis TaxID=1796055 RepID=A0AAV9U246_9PEZI
MEHVDGEDYARYVGRARAQDDRYRSAIPESTSTSSPGNRNIAAEPPALQGRFSTFEAQAREPPRPRVEFSDAFYPPGPPVHRIGGSVPDPDYSYRRYRESTYAEANEFMTGSQSQRRRLFETTGVPPPPIRAPPPMRFFDDDPLDDDEHPFYPPGPPAHRIGGSVPDPDYSYRRYRESTYAGANTPGYQSQRMRPHETTAVPSDPPVIGAPSPVESFDDDFSDDDGGLSDDDEDLINRKIAFHIGECDSILIQRDWDPVLLQVHLIALVEKYKVQDIEFSFQLAMLYRNKGKHEDAVRVLNDFKFDPRLTLSQNSMAYLLRMTANFHLKNVSAVSKDCRRIAQLLRKNSNNPDIKQIQNAANYYAGWCAGQNNNKADELYYNSLFNPKMDSPIVFFGSRPCPLKIFPLQSGSSLPADPGVQGSQAHTPSMITSKPPVPPPKVPPKAVPTSNLQPLIPSGSPLHSFSTYVHPQNKYVCEDQEKMYLEQVHSIRVLVGISTITIKTRKGKTTRQDPVNCCIAFQSQEQILQVIPHCIDTGRSSLAYRILSGYHEGRGSTSSTTVPVGRFYQIPYPPDAPYRPIECVQDAFQFLTLVKPLDPSFRVESERLRYKDGIKGLFTQLRKDIPQASKRVYEDALMVAITTHNFIAAVIIMSHMNSIGLDLQKFMLQGGLTGKKFDDLVKTPMTLVFIAGIQSNFDIQFPLIDPKDRMGQSYVKLFDCNSDKPNLFHVAAVYATKSATPLQFLLKEHGYQCKGNPDSVPCFNKLAVVPGYANKVTPMQILTTRQERLRVENIQQSERTEELGNLFTIMQRQLRDIQTS